MQFIDAFDWTQEVDWTHLTYTRKWIPFWGCDNRGKVKASSFVQFFYSLDIPVAFFGKKIRQSPTRSNRWQTKQIFGKFGQRHFKNQ